ncbi:MAG: DNA translocase FtsK [Clostridia bacterium]|nr:DNA translocase FtsK [Clostridia bacterium]
MANTKKKTGKKQNETRSSEKKRGTVNQLTAVIWLAVAVFMFALAVYPGGKLWLTLHNAVFGLFGITAFVVPVYIAALSIIYSMDKLKAAIKLKAIEAGVLLYFVSAAADVFSTVEVVSYSEHIANVYKAFSWKNGGVFGAIFGNGLCQLFEKTGAVIVMVILLFVALMIMTGTSVARLYSGAKQPVSAMGRKAKETFEEVREEQRKKRMVDFPVDDAVDTKDKSSVGEKGKRLVEAYADGNSEEIKKTEETTEENFAEKASRYGLIKDDYVPAVEEEDEPTPEKIKLTPEETAAEIKSVSDEIKGNMEVTEEECYEFPPISLLNQGKIENDSSVKNELESTATKLVDVLRSFGVETRIMDISRGPTVTRYELQPCAGVKISKITNLADDIALNLAAAGVRIEAPIPNKAAVGIEVPNKVTNTVSVREIIESNAFANSKSKLTVAMGKDIAGNPIVTDIAKMPHGLIAGQTGSGKSVCINSIIMSILYKAAPDEVKMLMIDPKVVELGIYNGIPHLLVPVVTDPKKASGALGWAVMEMEKRYRLFADNNVRDLVGFNRLCELDSDLQKLPQIVIIIDELADLMMTAPGEVEDSINRIAAKARAAGMHLLIATQRPSVDVVTGVIKANVPTRIAFAVASQIDSRTILDIGGAEKLLGRGDMLFNPVGASKPGRLQGCFVSDEEVERVVDFVKGNRPSEYSDEIQGEIERLAAAQKKGKGAAADDSDGNSDEDPMLLEAIKVVVEIGQASTSLLQRKLKLGYGRASRIIDQMEARGIIGPYEGAKPRQVLITAAEWMERQASEE